MYTKIPHDTLKLQFNRLITEVFSHMALQRRRFIKVLGNNATWESGVDKSQEKAKFIDLEECLVLFNYLIDNTYLRFGDIAFRQSIGIPMGTNAAVFIANLFLFTFELAFVREHINEPNLLKLFEFTMRYIDDILSLNNPQFVDIAKLIYPAELTLNRESSNFPIHFLDVKINVSDPSSPALLYTSPRQA